MISYDRLLQVVQEAFIARGLHVERSNKDSLRILIPQGPFAHETVHVTFRILDRKNIWVHANGVRMPGFKYLREPDAGVMVQSILCFFADYYKRKAQQALDESARHDFFVKAAMSFPDILARRQHQTRFGGVDAPEHERGNCYPTCVANLLDLDVESVPNFGPGKDWAEQAQKWLQDRGLSFMTFNTDPTAFGSPYTGLVVIAGGKSPRGHNHAVLWSDGKLLHDPHPEGGGLVPEPTDWDCFFVTNMARFKAFARTAT